MLNKEIIFISLRSHNPSKHIKSVYFWIWNPLRGRKESSWWDINPNGAPWPGTAMLLCLARNANGRISPLPILACCLSTSQESAIQYLHCNRYSTLSNILQRNKDNVYFAKHFYVAGCALLHWIFKLLRGESPQAVTGASHINMNTPGLTWISTWTMNFKLEFRYGLRNREMWNKSQKYASIYMETVPDAIQPAIGHELQII